MTLFGRRWRARQRDERGAFAVLFGLGCVMLFTVGALGVDIGNAVSRRTSIQSQADYGAYAAASKLPATATNKVGQAVDADTIAAVVAAMNDNQPQDDSRPCWVDNDCITAADLVDTDMTNGDVRYVSGCTSTSLPSCHKTDGLQVVAPDNRVDYGFADIIGVSNGTVRATATVNVFTGGLRVMPMFAVTGCDYGNQTLADPASGHSTTTVPTLYRRRRHQHDRPYGGHPGPHGLDEHRRRLPRQGLDRQQAAVRGVTLGRGSQDRVLPGRRRHRPADLPGRRRPSGVTG